MDQILSRSHLSLDDYVKCIARSSAFGKKLIIELDATSQVSPPSPSV